MIVGVLTAAAGYSILLALAEILYQRGLKAQVTRKITHIGGGIISATLPFLMTLPIAITLGLFF